MATISSITEIAALIGDPARASMMQALMDGRALTASELAAVAGVTPQTASGHLKRLTEAGLLGATHQGRHRYHRLASPKVAQLLESLMQVATEIRPVPIRTGPRDAALRQARTCYDHIAGRLGVALAERMAAEGWIEINDEAGLITPMGLERLEAAGMLVQTPRRSAPLCRPCLDWSERRFHVAGRLGAAICTSSLERGWIRKQAGTRALEITPIGRQAYRDLFGVEMIGQF
jgi:DNA-binding transcriptional ArsR family regulator